MESKYIKNKFIRIYAYLIMIMGVIALIITPFYFFPYSNLFGNIIDFITLIEFVILVISLGLIAYIFVKNIEKSQSILPIVYSILFIGFIIIEKIVRAKGIDPFDLSYFSNIMIIISIAISYVILIILARNTLKN